METFDYVIVGAGSSGCVLANRLSRDPRRSVLLIEAGGPDAEATAAEAGAGAVGLRCDVSDAAQMAAAFDRAAEQAGPIRLFCANAGVTAFERFAEMSAAHVDWIYDVDFHGVSRGIRAVLPGMLAAGEGHIVATASMAGLAPTWVPFHVPYTAAEVGVIGMLMNLRPELAERGVGCTVLCPGGVATDILNSPRRRPERFGGPSAAAITAPPGFRAPTGVKYVQRTPREVAQMTLAAVREDRPLVVTDPRMRGLYGDYAAGVMQAFDAAERWEAENGG